MVTVTGWAIKTWFPSAKPNPWARELAVRMSFLQEQLWIETRILFRAGHFSSPRPV